MRQEMAGRSSDIELSQEFHDDSGDVIKAGSPVWSVSKGFSGSTQQSFLSPDVQHSSRFSSVAPLLKDHEVNYIMEKALEAISSNNYLVELDPTDMNQAQFMWYLSMTGGDQSETFSGTTRKKTNVKKQCTLNDERFKIIPLSSEPALTLKKVVLSQAEAESLFDRYELLCPAKPKVSNSNSSSGADSLNHQPPQSMNLRKRHPRMAKKEEWTHLYCFNKADRKERMITIATGLTKRVRGLLRCCRTASVRLERLKAKEIEEWTRPKPKSSSLPMLQPRVQKNIVHHLSPERTIKVASADSLSAGTRSSSQQRVTPSLPILRPEATKHFARSKQHPSNGKPKPRPPPALVPLITNTLSKHSLPSVQSKVINQFSLPNLIPVHQTLKPISRPSNPVIIQMPTSDRSVRSAYRTYPRTYQPKWSKCKDVIDICSSDEEDMNPKHNAIIGALPSKPFVLPSGSKKNPSVNRCPVRSHPSTHRRASAKGHQRPYPPALRPASENLKVNNSSLKFSTKIESTSGTKISPPPFKGQQIKLAQPTAFPIARLGPSLPTVTSQKLGKLPMKKREQMKQSLLKIQQQEGKTPPLSSEKTTHSLTNEIRIKQIEGAIPKTFPLSSLPTVSNEDISKIVVNACKEPKQKGRTTLHYSEKQSALRKRSQDYSHFGQEDEDFESEFPITPSRKIPKADRRIFPRRECEGQQEDDGNNGVSTIIIEVDVGGLDESGSSSLGSLTPDSRSKQKKTELSQLREDECKELRRKGLEELLYSDQRITRSRNRSLPFAIVYNS